MNKQTFVITLGDPLSINIEAIYSLLEETKTTYPTILVGCLWQWHYQLGRLSKPRIDITPIDSLEDISDNRIYFLDIGDDSSQLDPSSLSKTVRGEIATRALYQLRDFKPAGKLAVLTAPIDKEACSLAGFSYPGHTEYFSAIWQGDGIMILAGPTLRVGLVTHHEPIANLSGMLTQQLVYRKIMLLTQTLSELLATSKLRLAICGFNPHCSDGGLFGHEEANVIAPALAAARKTLTECELLGPLPADSVFHKAISENLDGVLAMYHDQGLGPLKTVHFYDAVNITGGLRYFRISPDHGPARDLFLTGLARLDSFRAALKYCQRYLDGKHG